jgi:hypothetical protein
MLCPNCGTRLSSDKIICHFCGYHLSEQTIALKTVEVQNVTDQKVATSQSTSIQKTSNQKDTVTIVEKNNDIKNISLLALLMASFAFITAFANYLYQSMGESYSSSVTNATTGVTSTTLFPKSYNLFGLYTVDGWIYSFVLAIFAFVLAVGIIHFSKILK